MSEGGVPGLVHISSAVVRVRREDRAVAVERISGLPGVDVVHADANTIIIVMETPDADAAGACLAIIAATEGVLAASLVFEQAETEESLGEVI